jgi:FkbM family methyltransferase
MNTVVRKLVRGLGYDLLKARHSPAANLLGLRNYPIRSILDIGAATGGFARSMRREFPDAHISCFEPLPDSFARLAAWAGSQGGAVTAINLALGAESGSVEMHRHLDFSDSSSILPTTRTPERLRDHTRRQERITVRQATLDEAAAALDPAPAPDLLIKADVQGYEDRVIRGGRATFARARACIVEACMKPLYDGQASFGDLVRSLDDLGLDYAGNLVQYCGADGRAVFVDALFIRE